MLGFQLVCDVALVEGDEADGFGIAVGDQLLSDARLAVVRLANRGRRPISVDGVRVEFDPPRLVHGAIDHTEPDNLIPDDALARMIELHPAPTGASPGRALYASAELKDLFLNSQESIWLTFLTAAGGRLRMVGHPTGSTIAEEVGISWWAAVALVVLAVALGLLVSHGLAPLLTAGQGAP